MLPWILRDLAIKKVIGNEKRHIVLRQSTIRLRNDRRENMSSNTVHMFRWEVAVLTDKDDPTMVAELTAEPTSTGHEETQNPVEYVHSRKTILHRKGHFKTPEKLITFYFGSVNQRHFTNACVIGVSRHPTGSRRLPVLTSLAGIVRTPKTAYVSYSLALRCPRMSRPTSPPKRSW